MFFIAFLIHALTSLLFSLYLEHYARYWGSMKELDMNPAFKLPPLWWGHSRKHNNNLRQYVLNAREEAQTALRGGSCNLRGIRKGFVKYIVCELSLKGWQGCFLLLRCHFTSFSPFKFRAIPSRFSLDSSLFVRPFLMTQHNLFIFSFLFLNQESLCTYPIASVILFLVLHLSEYTVLGSPG